MKQSCANTNDFAFRVAAVVVVVLACALLLAVPRLAYADDVAPNLTDISGMFENCGNLDSVDMSGFSADVTDAHDLFNDCDNLQSADVSDLDTRGATDLGGMFYAQDDSNPSVTWLSRITLGPDFRFTGDGIAVVGDQALFLTPPTEDGYSGKWVRGSDPYGSPQYTPEELRGAFDANPTDMAGTYIWGRQGMVIYDANNGTGTMEPSAMESSAGVTLRANEFTPPVQHRFVCWNTRQDGSGADYYPGGTYVPTGVVTLYAKWEYIPVDMPLAGIDSLTGAALAVAGAIALLFIASFIVALRRRRG